MTAIFSIFASMSDRRLVAWGIRYTPGAGVCVLSCLLVILAFATVSSATPLQQCNAPPGAWIEGLDRADQELILRRTRDQCLRVAGWMKQQTLDGSEQVKRQVCQDLALVWSFKECEYRRDYIDRRAYAPCMVWSREVYRRCRADDLAWFEAAADGDGRAR